MQCASHVLGRIVPPWGGLRGHDRYQRIKPGDAGRAGKGSYGEVYAAMDTLKDRIVAVKVQESQSKAAEREYHMYNILSAYPHENVQALLDTFVMPTSSLGKGLMCFVFSYSPMTLWETFSCRTGLKGLLERPRVLNYVRGMVHGVGWLHGLKMVHGDLSMANFLVTDDNKILVSDYGTAFSSASSLSAAPPKCTLYVAAPEAILRAQPLGSSIDCWAVGINTLALMTGEIPTLRRETGADDQHIMVFAAQVQLLGYPSDESWPGHATLPMWKSVSTAIDDTPRVCSLEEVILKSSMWAHDSLKGNVLAFVGGLLRWSPEQRWTMELASSAKLLQCHDALPPQEEVRSRKASGCSFDDEAPPGKKAKPLDMSSKGPLHDKSDAVKKPSLTKRDTDTDCSPARSPAPSPAPDAGESMGSDASGPTSDLCQCTGNCGMQACASNKNKRRKSNGSLPNVICREVCVNGTKYCVQCKCELDGCMGPRHFYTGRFCRVHDKTHNTGNKSSFVNRMGVHQMQKSWSSEIRTLARLSFIFDRPLSLPWDIKAWVDFCAKICPPKRNATIPPETFALLFFAHAVKWPVLVNHWATLHLEVHRYYYVGKY